MRRITILVIYSIMVTAVQKIYTDRCDGCKMMLRFPRRLRKK